MLGMSVRDMWLTGFDAPSMHARYTDKPIEGYDLMHFSTKKSLEIRLADAAKFPGILDLEPPKGTN
jgi:hypothetical protein